jgi:undecaprenyl-diphosphatase
MKLLTNLGERDLVVIVPVMSYILVSQNHQKEAIWLISLFAIGFVTNFLLKTMIHRQRPQLDPLVHEKYYSFPSGHSMGSILYYGFGIFLIQKLSSNSAPSLTSSFDFNQPVNIICYFLASLIPVIGFSRVYLGVHYPSDVLAGWLVL